MPLDYQALLRLDPTLRALLTQINTAGARNAISLRGAQQQTLGRLGETIDPATLPPEIAAQLGNLGAALTPELAGIVDAGNQAGVSALAQLQRRYDRAQSATVGNLAGRNMLRSGAYGQHSANNLQDFTLGQYNARQSALDQLAGLQDTYLAGQENLAGQAAQGTVDWLDRINQQNGMIAPPPTTPKPRPLAAPTRAGQVARNTAGLEPPKLPPAAPRRPQTARNAY